MRAFFYFQKIGTDSVYQADSRDIKILVQIPEKSILKFLFGFEIAWVAFNEGFLFDFTSAYAISTPVIFNFWSVFICVGFVPCESL